MTRALSSTQIQIDHRFEVPYDSVHGVDWKDFGMARHWAEKKARQLGVDIASDDWCRLIFEDDQLTFIVTEKVDAEESARILTSIRRSISSHVPGNLPGDQQPTAPGVGAHG